MKLVYLLVCLSLVARIYASDDYWCIFYKFNSDKECQTCYNSDVVGGKCTGRKVPGCKIIYSLGYSSNCQQCSEGFYSFDWDGVDRKVDEQCKPVSQADLVDNCVGYAKSQNGGIYCKECGRRYKPGLTGDKPNNTCVKSNDTNCERQSFRFIYNGVPYWTCN